MLTGEMLRAARALARLDQTELAATAGLSPETVKRLERIRGVVNANSRTLAALVQALEGFGVFFDIGADGRVAVWRREPPLGAPHSPDAWGVDRG